MGPKSFRCIEKCLKPERSVECYRCAHPSCVCQVEGNVPVPEVGEEQVMVRVVVAIEYSSSCGGDHLLLETLAEMLVYKY